jgi:hypothetical protein
MKSDRDKYINAGANGFLSKPIDLNRFYEVLASFLTLKTRDENIATSAETNSAFVKSHEASPRESQYTYTSELAEDEEFKELILKFVEMLPGITNEITKAAHDQDWSALQSLSHRLKGSGGGYGFHALTEIAGKINHDVTLGIHKDIDSYISNLNMMTDGIVNHFSKRAAS